VHGGANNPKLFPHGEVILRIMPQTVCNIKTLDRSGCPISIVSTDFSPTEAFEHVNIEQYMEFIKYSLEYQQLICEHLAEQKEREILQQAKENNIELDEPYGVLQQCTVIRNLSGLTFEHLGAKGKEISRAVTGKIFNCYLAY
jgi:hypothetical protein